MSEQDEISLASLVVDSEKNSDKFDLIFEKIINATIFDNNHFSLDFDNAFANLFQGLNKNEELSYNEITNYFVIFFQLNLK